MACALEESSFNLSTCVLCQGDKDLIFLTCLHSCCADCVAQCQDGNILCPECDIQTTITESTTKNFIQPILRKIAEISDAKVCVMCSVYDKKTMSTHICPECDGDQFCGDCLKAHRAMRVSKHHEPIPLEEMNDELKTRILKKSQEPCHKHHSERNPQLLFLFCETCKEKVCQTCVTTIHTPGEHNISTMEQIAEQEKQDYERQIKPLEDEFKEVMKIITNSKLNAEGGRESRMQGRIADIQNRVDQAKKETSEFLDQVAAEHIEKIRNNVEELTKRDDEFPLHTKRLEILMKNMGVLREYFERLHDYGDTKCFKDFMLKQLGEITKEVKKQKHTLGEIVYGQELGIGEPTLEINTALALQFVGNLEQTDVPRKDFGSGLTIESAVDARIEQRESNLAVVSEFKIDVMDRIHTIEFIDENTLIVGGNIGEPEERALHIYSLKGDRKSVLPHSLANVYQLKVHNNEIYMACDKEECVKRTSMNGTTIDEVKNPENMYVHGVEVTNDRIYFTSSNPGRIYTCGINSTNDVTLWSQSSVDLSAPTKLCATKTGNMAMFDQRCREIILLDKDGQLAQQYDNGGYLPGYSFEDICCDGGNRLLYTSDVRSTVVVLSASCEFLCELFEEKEFGIIGPCALGLSPSGRYLAIGHLYGITVLERVWK